MFFKAAEAVAKIVSNLKSNSHSQSKHSKNKKLGIACAQ